MTPTPRLDRAKLRELAEKATPGPWEVDCGVSTRSAWAIWNGKRTVLHLDIAKNVELDEEYNNVEETLEYVAAANPAVVLALLDENAKLRAALEFYARAKVLFLTIDGTMPSALDATLGVCAGFNESEMHIKDDGQRARQALSEGTG